MGASLVGFFHLTGWPDRPPCGPFGAYSDYPSPRFALCAVLAALDHRRRTGEGQYLDFAQAEACVHFLAPAVLDHVVNGARVDAQRQRRSGDGAARRVPGAGDDAWVAIACRDDADWRALAELVGRADLARWRTEERRARRAELDDVVAAWTAARRPTTHRPRRRRRRAGPRRAELRRVHRRPAARPPRALGDAAPPRARHDRRRGLAAGAVGHAGRGQRRPARSSARTPSRCSPSCSATTTTASASCSPPARSTDERAVPICGAPSGTEDDTSDGTLSSVRTGAAVPAPISDRFEASSSSGLDRSAEPDGQRFRLPDEEATY